jgi:hypothetical protein
MRMKSIAWVLPVVMAACVGAQDPAPVKKPVPCPKGKTCPADGTQGGDSSQPPKSPAQAFPFPKEDSQKNSLPGDDADVPGMAPAPPAPAPNKNGLPEMPRDGREPDPPGMSSSSSSSSDTGASSSSDTEDKDDPVAPTTQDGDSPVKAAPLNDLGSSGSTSARREKLEKTRIADDLKVGNFYRNDGNWMGWYLRMKDAVDHDPENEEAHWGMAQAAEKLKKTDEAKAHYEEYLRLDPEGDHAKDAAQALKALPKAGAAK